MENIGVIPVPAASIINVSRFSIFCKLNDPRGLEIVNVSPIRQSPNFLLKFPSEYRLTIKQILSVVNVAARTLLLERHCGTGV